ncbi:3-hydroxyacyl-CoA dehydrogenase [Collimonas sp. PA-H2]|uniref:3-hydroxyacyl-CoA dehydrogenase NAD-binding domain-containing protein n=1 Tax=Collimonas sp. PA-H2 TaxID=1881062 RepID=UPI000BF3833B|nr:3-hydroxyacyl-CoA dehydrogenase NAD-binding domain-containing protein [Collimonas sp. PA-H2]PFH10253.1 3-hydroxyacyl-CoA dehydrogenase [Collimonas sp. PA-H2]
MVKTIQRVAIIGSGTIGASWAALFLARGLHVTATDIAPDAEAKLRQYIDQAWPALKRIGMVDGADQNKLRFTADLADAVSGADLVQENGPERLDFKIALYEQLDSLLPADTLIVSSSSGLTMSAIQTGCKLHPERCVIGHPFNPPHLIPLVEIVGGKLTSEATIERVTAFYDGLGKRTVRLHKEMPGHVANRLAAALFREIVYLVSEGVLSVADADTAVCWGPGLRWGVMGPSLLYHLGGGEGGIEHFFDQFSGPMQAWWKVLGNPVITPEIRKQMIDGVKAEADGRSLDELAGQRDEALLSLLAARANE